MHGADLKSKLSTPPGEDVLWNVEVPDIPEGQTRCIDSIREASRAWLSLPNVRIRARTWFEARAHAVRVWAALGFLVNPQSVRKGGIVP